MQTTNQKSKVKKYLLFLGLLLILILGGFIYYMNMDRLEDYEELAKKLPTSKKMAIAKITKIDKRNTFKIRGKSFSNGYLYTYVFSAKNKRYMGNDFLHEIKYQINDTATVIYLPENPSVNEFKK